jgi:hypothetical protein
LKVLERITKRQFLYEFNYMAADVPGTATMISPAPPRASGAQKP